MSNVLLFGDQTADQSTLLQKIVLRKENALASNFLERAARALREETSLLPRNQRDVIPDFLSINDLKENYWQKGRKVPMIESALLTIAQLGHFIGYFSENPSELPATNNTRALGLCTGLLAAAAVVSSKTVTELVLIGVEFVRLSFRSGAVVDAARNVLSQVGEENAPWSTIVTGTTEQAAKEALAAFHKEKGIPQSSFAYISAVSVMAITVSGPPTTVKRFFEESPALAKNHRVPIPVYAPYHAEHLFGEADFAKILNGPVVETLKKFQPASLVHSAATGKAFAAENTLELVKAVLAEMLQSPVRWDRLLEETVSQISANKAATKIWAVGISNVANSLVSALKAGGKSEVSTIDSSAWNDNNVLTNGRTYNDKIAIVGMAGRYPNAANHEALWDLLMKGLDVHRRIPADRFDADAHCDPSGKGKNKSHTPFGCFIDEPGLFDPRFFNMSPREAAQTDPMGRLALVTAYEALEMSGYVPNRTPSTKLHRIGTFYGQTSDDWREINAAENVDTYYITGGVRAFAPGRINYYFKFSGPSYSIDTACSSSLAAIQLACTSLWAGDCDTACAGGLNVLTNPDIFSGLSKGQFLSKTGKN